MMTVAKIHADLEKCLYIGNLNAKRDWGHAKDYVEGMWSIMQHHEADDFVLAASETLSVRESIELAFAGIGISIEWQGEGFDEIGINKKKGQIVVKVDPRYFRPTEVDLLLGDSSKANTLLGWKHATSFEKLLKRWFNLISSSIRKTKKF